MFIDVTKKICEGLVAREFSVLSAQGDGSNISEKSSKIILIKNESPLIYLVSILNSEYFNIETYEIQMNDYLSNLENNIMKYGCSRIINLNIVVCKNKDEHILQYINTKEIIIDSKVLNVWWSVDMDKGNIYVADNHPSEILNIRNLILNSFVNVEATDNISIHELEKKVKTETALKIRSNNHYLTYALMAINIAIWIAITLMGNENMMFSKFANGYNRTIRNHEYYRLVTSMFFHVGFQHIAYNCFSLYLFGAKAEEYYGKISFIIIYFVSGIFGSLASVFFTRSSSVGASGGLYGIIGSILVLTMIKKKSIRGLSHLTILILIFTGLALGFIDMGVDNYAHMGGLIAGIISSFILIKIVGE